MGSRSPAQSSCFRSATVCTYMLKINSSVEFTVPRLVIAASPQPIRHAQQHIQTLGLKSAFAPHGTLQQALLRSSSLALALQLQGKHRKGISLDMGRDPWCVCTMHNAISYLVLQFLRHLLKCLSNKLTVRAPPCIEEH